MSTFKEPPNNDGRADFAAAALAAYFSETRADPPFYGEEGSEDFIEAFGDLLCDLQHLAKRAGSDFAAMLAQGTRAFKEEDSALDAPVYAALDENYQTFGDIAVIAGIEDMNALSESLSRLQEAGRAEMYPGRGWRQVTVPLDERVYAELTVKFAYSKDLEARLLVPAAKLRESLLRLQEAGKAEMLVTRGWRRAEVKL